MPDALKEELRVCNEKLAKMPDSIELLCQRSVILMRSNCFSQALESVNTALDLNSNFGSAAYLKGIILKKLGRLDEALECFDSAIAHEPRFADAYNSHGSILLGRKLFQEALVDFKIAIQLSPRFSDAYNNQAIAFRELGSFEEALKSYRSALEIVPSFASAHYNCANLLRDMGRVTEAIQHYQSAIAARPDFAEACNNCGGAFFALKQYENALECYNRAISTKMDYAEAYCNKGVVLQILRQTEKAVKNFDAAIMIDEGYAAAYSYRGLSLYELGQNSAALESLLRAIDLAPGDAKNYCNLGKIMREMHRYADAISAYQRALELDPSDGFAFDGIADCSARACEWSGRAQILEKMMGDLATANTPSPFVALGYCGNMQRLKIISEIFFQREAGEFAKKASRSLQAGADKIRLAYLSADFRKHPTAFLLADVIELHNREKFDVIGVSFGPIDHSEIHDRIKLAFDEVHDVQAASDVEISQLLQRLEIDIVIDLMGYTQFSRLGIFGYRGAPVQVNYLGFPGTMGSDCFDYIIADRIVLPEAHKIFFNERIEYLTNCYQPNSVRIKAERSFTRSEVGLPNSGFVFCCFNNHWKITPEIFCIWMNLLSRVEGSVLWMIGSNILAENNLRKEARLRGIDPERLIFAPRIENSEHLSRHSLADLFLDTLPYNAHTTASDALWAGVPIVTCMGEGFAGRVAGSILTAIGLPELVATTLADYESLAFNLAAHPDQLVAVRTKILRNRSEMPLFDTKSYVADLEAAYIRMMDRTKGAEI